MLGSIIKSDRFIVFPSDTCDAIKAAMECDGLSYVYVDVYESVVQVSIHSNKSCKYANEKDIWKRIEEIMEKYDITFKYKKF